ncbi:hypothetical protein EYF80_033592 [Liparis tanakae]|uniref:Uncharacterized protein n=1 Tax=Liparis tanakae TaxID=230148 RepID=A0A4Z2GRW1_9TELE|nr:hypothetical protein EYF80_033592 [Liparis tanakae]
MAALDVWERTFDLASSGKKKSCSSAVVTFSWLGMLTLNRSLCFDFVPFVTERGMSFSTLDSASPFSRRSSSDSWE